MKFYKENGYRFFILGGVSRFLRLFMFDFGSFVNGGVMRIIVKSFIMCYEKSSFVCSFLNMTFSVCSFVGMSFVFFISVSFGNFIVYSFII